MWRRWLTGACLAGLLGAAGWGWHEARQPGHFPLGEIRFQGARYTDVDGALASLALAQGTNLLTISPAEARERLEDLPWVERATVKRLFPDALGVVLKEKMAVCMGRIDGRLMLLDRFGEVIKPLGPHDPLVLPLVTPLGVGEEGRAEVVALMNLLTARPWLRQRVAQAQGLPGGRWALHTHRGARVLLGEEPERALDFLARLQERRQVLDRRIRQVDLRIAGKVALRPEA